MTADDFRALVRAADALYAEHDNACTVPDEMACLEHVRLANAALDAGDLLFSAEQAEVAW